MLIGEAPGAEEERSSPPRPFVGPAGKKLNEALLAAGIDRSSVYISNSAKCRPPLNRPPEKDELAACFPYLLEEIETVRPKVIVLLGNTALGALTGEAKDITKRRGKLLTLRKGLRIDAKVISTFHPSSVLRSQGQGNYDRIVEDLKHAVALTGSQEQVTPPNTHIFPPGSSDQVIIQALALLSETEGRVITCDLEWTKGNNTKDMIWPWSSRGEAFSIAFTGMTPTGEASVSISLPLSPAVHGVVARLLANRNITCHNATGDLLWLKGQGLEVNLAADTLVLGYLLDETQTLNLEDLAVKYGGAQGGWKGHLFEQRPVTQEQWTEILTYGAADTSATLATLRGLTQAVVASPRRKDIMNLHRHLLVPVTKVLAKAAYAGVPIDEEQLALETQKTEVRYLEAASSLAEVVHTTPQRALDLANSPKQTMDYLKSIGIEVESTEQDVLKQWAEYPAVAAILKVREEGKLLSTYLRPWAMLIKRQGDGRLHSIYKPTGARTGRSSAEGEGGGTIQTAPRKSWVRALVKAKPGRLLVGGDYSTVEMRMAAYYANDQVMLELFRSGVSWNEKGEQIDFDIHRAVAAFIKRQAQGPIALEEFLNNRQILEPLVVKDERQGAKGVNFGLTFGMESEKLVDYSRNTYGVIMTLEQAKFARDSYMRLFSQLPVWHERARRLAKSTGYSQRTVFGRIRKFEDEADVNAAINTPVQATANDFAYLAMVQTDQYLVQEQLNAFVIGYIHDSVMLDCAERDAPRAKQILDYVMPNVNTDAFDFKFPIPLPCETKIGESWAA